MTEEEKNTVRSLREQGYRYKTISNITGIHRETIKSHLNRHRISEGRDFHTRQSGRYSPTEIDTKTGGIIERCKKGSVK